MSVFEASITEYGNTSLYAITSEPDKKFIISRNPLDNKTA